MESVPSDTLGGNRPRQRVSRGYLGLCMMEGGIKAGDLRQCRVKFCDGVDGGKIMGLMQGRQRNEAAQLVNDRRIALDGDGIA